MRKYFFSPHFEHMNPSFWQTGFVSLSSRMVVKSNSFFNFSHSPHTGSSGRKSSSSEFPDILPHNFGIPLLPVFGSYVSLTFLILTPFKYHFKSIQETHPNNKVLHSFYKPHIVRDHEQRQSEMTDHNKDKPYLQSDYWNLVGLTNSFPNYQ